MRISYLPKALYLRDPLPFTKADDLIYELLRRLNKEYNQTFIVVTHNEEMASKADRIIRLVDGKITDQ